MKNIFASLLLVMAVQVSGNAAAGTHSEVVMEVSQLTEEQRAFLNDDRKWVDEILATNRLGAPLIGAQADLPSLHALLDRGSFAVDNTAELAAVGTAFGDVLAKEIGLHWVVVTDEHGTDFALKYQSKHVFVFPRDMIIKRFERGERLGDIDLSFVLQEVERAVLAQAADAKSDAP